MAAAIRVLYVDDESDLLDIGKLFLMESGDFTVTTALSAPDAIRLLEKEKFDAIISDYQMPAMDGIQFLIEVRSRFGPVPFILFTGKGREEIVIQAINNGVDFYIQKGGDPNAQFAELAHKVRQAIARCNAEKQIKQSEEKFSAAFTISPDPVAITDLKTGTLININPAFSAWSGYSSEELIGKTTKELNLWANTHDRDEIVAALLAHENITDKAIELRNKDGDLRNCLFSARIISIDGNDYLFTRSRDITEQIRASHVLQQSEERYKNISESTSDFVFACIKPGGGTYSIDWIAGAVEKITGYTIDELRAMVCWRCLVHPDDTPVFDENITNLPEGTSRSCILRIRTKNGTERWLAVSTTHIPGKDSSSCCHVFGGCRDITERKLAEETLKESEEFNRTLIENLPDYIIVYRPDGKILYVNPATEKGFGYNLNELVGTSVISYVAPECRTRVTATIATRLKGDDTPEYETVLITKDGQRKTVIAKGTRVHYHDGPATLLLLTDITERKVAERVLLESEEKYRVIFNNDIYAICIFDLDTLKLLDVNDTYTKLYGYTRNELLSGMTVHDITAEHEASDSATGEAINRGTIFIPLRYHKKKDNTIFPVEIVGGPYLWNGKKVMFALFHDITERKNAEDKLRKSEEKYRQLIELAQEGIWAIDADGNTTYVNQQMAKILGYNAEEMLGVHLFSFMDDTGKIIAAANMERRRQGIKENHDFEFITKVGNRIYAHLSTSPIIDEKGVYLGALAVVTDITERKNAEVALKTEKQRLANIIEGTRAGTWEWNVQTGETIFNEQWAEITGYTLSELSPISIKTWMNYAHPDDLQKSGELLEQHFLQKSEWYECECRMKHKNGDWVWVLDRGKVASWTKDGKPLWMYGTHQDITERKVAEEALHLANKKLNLLTSVSRHDINNQLTVLQGYLNILGKKQSDPVQKDYLQKASASAQRILSMVRFTKEYEQIGIKSPVWQDCRQIVEIAATEASPGTVTVNNDFPAGTEVFADPLIVKVFYNLVDNAVRYGEKITTIRFFVEGSGDNPVIVCEDDGNGIPAEEKEKIFELGFGRNTGLGLAISREILSITGITIRETGEPGNGARFELTVPEGTWRMAGDGD